MVGKAADPELRPFSVRGCRDCEQGQKELSRLSLGEGSRKVNGEEHILLLAPSHSSTPILLFLVPATASTFMAILLITPASLRLGWSFQEGVLK